MDSSDPAAVSPRLLFAPVPSEIGLAAIPDSVPSPKGASGVLLLERHLRIPSREVLTRTVRRIPAPGEAQDPSRVPLDFDPATEEVTFHYLHVIRDGATRASIDPAAFRFLPRRIQPGADDGEGCLTAVTHLEEVEPGDLVDFAFTTRNRAPAFEGKFFFGFALGWPFPVAEAVLTASLPPGARLAQRAGGLGSEPRREGLPEGGERLSWHLRNPKHVPNDPTIPSWHIPVPYFQASDFADWNEVAAHTYRLWAPSLEGTSAPFRQLAADLAAEHATPEAYAQAAIRFTQDQIRFLKLEEGLRSYLPEDPDAVLARRAGDPKGKSLLLCALLRAGGVAAWPVLVNSILQHAIADFLPSPAAFNHVIVCVRIEKQTFWVDPVVSSQGGTLGTRVLPRFVNGLIVHPKSKGLVKLPKPTPESGETIVQEDYSIDYRGKSARLSSLTTLRGTEADALRQTFARVGQPETAAEFLRVLQSLHPGAEREKALEIDDDRDANEIVLRERFRLPGFLQTNPKSRQDFVRLPGHAIARNLATTTESKREHPFHLPLPTRVLHILTATIPEGVRFEKSRETVDGPGFTYSRATSVRAGGVEIRSSFVTTANRVDPADFPLYRAKLHRVSETLGLTFPLPRKALSGKARSFLGVGAALAVTGVVILMMSVVIGDGGKKSSGLAPLDDEPTTLTVIDKPAVEDEDASFDRNLSDGIRDVLNDPGAVDIKGPSLLDAREFDFSLDPAIKTEEPINRIEGIPSITD